MPHTSNTQYLDSKVFTASQPQLHLMLLEGALRFGRQARQLWDDWDKDAEFTEIDALLARMADVVDELAHSAAAGSEEISQQLEEQYAFIYRELAACRINRSLEKLDSCLKLLEYERETWKLACEKLEAATNKPGLPHMPNGSLQPSEGFSLEA